MPFDAPFPEVPLHNHGDVRIPPARRRRRGVCAALSGAAAEDRVVAAYLRRGAEVLARNYRAERAYGGGEIDIVARLDGMIVFVEVKSRKTMNAALCAVSSAQWLRLEMAALRFMMVHQMGEPDCRFDLVALDGAGRMEVVENAHGH